MKQDIVTFNHGKVVNVYTVYEIIKIAVIGSYDNYPTLQSALFGAVKLTKNADIGKYECSGYGIGFDIKSWFSHPSGGDGQNVMIFEVDMSSSTMTGNRKEDILIIGKGPLQGLEHTLTLVKMYSINFSRREE